MRVAVFSDVHGNFAALDAVLEDIARQGVDTAVFAGDLCLVGPQPAECVARLQAWRGTAVYGNTDDWLLARQEPPQKLQALAEWTAAQLSGAQRAWLAALPFAQQIVPAGNPDEALLIVHANPLDVNQLVFPSEAEQRQHYGRVRQTDAEAAPLFAAVAQEIIAFGHLHLPFERHLQGKRLINISSVSMPGDGDGRAKYGLFTWDGAAWSFERCLVSFQVGRHRQAYLHNQPPGWRAFVEQIDRLGFVPQTI